MNERPRSSYFERKLETRPYYQRNSNGEENQPQEMGARAPPRRNAVIPNEGRTHRRWRKEFHRRDSEF
jgi:hypothetical protein